MGHPLAKKQRGRLALTIPPPCQWPGPCFFFREGGSIGKGGHVSSFERGGPLAWGVHWHGGSIGMGGGGGTQESRALQTSQNSPRILAPAA